MPSTTIDSTRTRISAGNLNNACPMYADPHRKSASTRFTTALAGGDLQAIRACPKADLHTHGFAKADRDYVREKTGRDIVTVKVPLRSMEEMHEWARTNIGDLFAGRDGRTLGIEANFAGAWRRGSS